MILSYSTPVFADEIVGRMSAAYGYALNDMIWEYGVLKTSYNGEELIDPDGGEISPGGIVYSDIINFDANNKPYLVIFSVNSDTRNGEVHIWEYNEETKKAEKIAELDKPYSEIARDRMGEFNLGYNDEKRYISYKEYENNVLVSEEYYTVIDGETFMYVNKPKNVYDEGIMNFNCAYFHANVDTSDFNRPLDNFFTNLKNAAADSVTYEDITERLEPDEENRVEDILAKAVQYTQFDILECTSINDYKLRLGNKNCTDKFYLITNMYNLGNGLYYIRFSTDRSFYNYTLLRKTDEVNGGYQILKIVSDCIPLSDSELKQAAETYSRCPLLYKKSPHKAALKSKVNLAEFKEKLPKVNVDKKIDANTKAPVALIGGGICLALLVVLWIVLTADDEKK